MSDTATYTVEEVLAKMSAIADRIEKAVGEKKMETGIHGDAWPANVKRTYEEYQDISLTSARRSQDNYDKVQGVALQALQNAVETANMVGKAAVRQQDIATDNQWNPVQQGAGDTLTARAVSLDDASLKAIGAMVANVLAQVQPKTA